MPLRSSHGEPARPSPLLALVCAAIVRAFNPAWLSKPVVQLAAEVDVRPERVSRLSRRILSSLTGLLARLSTRGRRRPERPPEIASGSVLRNELLAVASEIIRSFGIRTRRIQDFVVAARDRLHRELGLSHHDFCHSLGLSERTVRHWAERGVETPREPDPHQLSPPPADRHEGRFDLDVTLPGLQSQVDTTDFELFGLPLKIVALQDPGDRDQNLWQAFAVEEKEDSEVVIRVVKAALADHPGTQLVTDQGTPYMAKATEEALAELEIDHVPQKEATPTAKATLERSFGTVKTALAGFAAFTKKIAEAVPALADTALAKAFGRVLLATFLRVYAAARSAPEVCRPGDPVVLAAVAEACRERARAEEHSSRLLLADIFERYCFEGSKQRFVNAHRRFHPDDIREAERRVGVRFCRCHVRVCDRYFAAVLRNVAEAGQARRLKLRRERLRRHEQQKQDLEIRALAEYRRQNPEPTVAEALALIAGQHLPATGGLFAGGLGPGSNLLRSALARIAEESPLILLDRAEVGWRQWIATSPDHRILPLVRTVFDRLLHETTNPQSSCPADRDSATLPPGSRNQNTGRPPAVSLLRFSAACSAAT
jgi:transposase InsO family protein